MDGVTFLTDETNKNRFVQIDLEQLELHQNKIGDLLDVVIAESRKNDEEISWDDLKSQLKSDAKL